jgi:hypothetical protein
MSRVSAIKSNLRSLPSRLTWVYSHMVPRVVGVGRCESGRFLFEMEVEARLKPKLSAPFLPQTGLPSEERQTLIVLTVVPSPEFVSGPSEGFSTILLLLNLLAWSIMNTQSVTLGPNHTSERDMATRVSGCTCLFVSNVTS